jgi:dTDP-D-glucose 4,6-dehydratase
MSSYRINELEFPMFSEGNDRIKYLDLSYSRQGQDVRYALNDDKLRALGWEPKAVFDEELPAIVEYYKENFIW